MKKEKAEVPAPPPENRDAVAKQRKPVAPPSPLEEWEDPPGGLEPHYHETTQHAPKLHDQRTKAAAPTARSQQRRFPR